MRLQIGGNIDKLWPHRCSSDIGVAMKMPKPVSAARFRLADIDPADHLGLENKDHTREKTERITQEIGDLQQQLFADSTQALLVVLQGMDTAGKDGTIRRVFDHVNPAGVHVCSFKTPSAEEKLHDFLWRVHQRVPAYGQIGIFNRSHYEDVLIVRVHADQMLPPHLRRDRHIFQRRFDMINAFEDSLSLSRIKIIKFFLHISKAEQKARLEAREQERDKNWKLSASDFAERKYWDRYQTCYQDAIAHTSTPRAPWYVIPSDHKWVRDICVATLVRDALLSMKPRPPMPVDKPGSAAK
jgi:PPK2 family polyphosphate:nucleotide phosphotransferase